ncbi:MAG: RluA family pseudouridine synthase [Elusimicrobia bacterium]|nr:RluA family pseudouridine synthase [Elusimicrobiota bacterium]
MKAKEFAADGPGERLDHFLARRLEGVTRGFCQDLISRGRVTVGGARRGSDYRLRDGDFIRVEQGQAPWPPLRFESWILREDKALIVLRKPSGLLMHPLGETWLKSPEAAAAEPEPNLAGLICRERPAIIQAKVPRCGLVHRLDRQTSGVLLLAKTQEAYRALVRAFARREVAKTYRAIVLGEPRKERMGVDAPVGRLPGRRRMEVLPWGRVAQTEFRVLKRARGAALVEAEPRTGRTHQIRVHLAELGLPVLGDHEWIRAAERERMERFGLPHPPRMMLHAYRLAVAHPSTRERLRFVAPLPKDFRDYWRSLTGSR